MQLTLYTDYSLRTLIYLAANSDRSATINEISEFYRISRNHLVKVVHNLSVKGFIISTRGKGGGLRLAREAKLIRVGDVVLECEPNFHIVECFNATAQPCVVDPICALKPMLSRALQKFLSELNQYTVADLLIQDAISSSYQPLTFFPTKP